MCMGREKEGAQRRFGIFDALSWSEVGSKTSSATRALSAGLLVRRGDAMSCMKTGYASQKKPVGPLFDFCREQPHPGAASSVAQRREEWEDSSVFFGYVPIEVR
jgi:hypothetical protein